MRKIPYDSNITGVLTTPIIINGTHIAEGKRNKTQHEEGRQPHPNTYRPTRPAPQCTERLQLSGNSSEFERSSLKIILKNKCKRFELRAIFPDQDYLEQRYADKAIEFIQQKKEDPIFIYIAHAMPHRPLHVSPEFMKKRCPAVNTMIEGEQKADRDFIYKYAVEEIDHHIGRIKEELEKLGLDDNTLIIFTSDNGSTTNLIYRSCEPFQGGKGSTYEGGFRVPLLAQWPGVIEPGRISSEIVASLDLLPTIARLCGGKTPVGRDIDGIDMADFILGKTRKSGRDHYYYYNSNNLVAIRQKNLKYHYREGLLFNLEKDVSESSNLAAENPEKVRELSESGSSFDKSLIRRPIGVFNED